MTRAKRSGGRTGRMAERQGGSGSGPTEAIWPGIEGGQYQPLHPSEIAMVDETAMRILEEIGLKGATQPCIDTVCGAEGRLTDDGRLLMPQDLVRAVLKTAGRGFKLFGQSRDYDIDPTGKRIHFGTSGAAVHIVDSKTREIRDSTLRDLHNMARLAEALPNIHMFQRTVVARDLTDPREMDLNTAYACLKGTAKPTGTSFGSAELLAALDGANLVYEAAGMYGSLLGCSLESFVLDNDMIGSILRATRGFEVSAETLSLETIREICISGPGHFLGHDQTLNRMQSDYYYPAMANRRTPQEWDVAPDKDLLQRARIRTRELLAAPEPSHISPEIDAEIRARYPIRLR